MYNDLIGFIKSLYNTNGNLSLHEPFFDDEDKKALIEVIESSYVSSVGAMITDFENEIRKFTNSRYAIATVNGTSALHTSLKLSGVSVNDEVIKQSLTFILPQMQLFIAVQYPTI